MRTTALAIAIALLAASTVTAQPSKKGKGADPSPIEVTVSQLNDRRTTSFFSQLAIRLQLKGILEWEVSAARVTIRKAVDDTGADLLDPEAGEPRFEATSGSMYGDKESKEPATIGLTLKNPSRDAVTLKEVRGEVELYMPLKDKDAVVAIPKFQSLAGKPVSNKTLKANGIEISVIGTAQLEAEKKKASKAKADQLKAEGTDAETLKWMIESFEQSFYTPSEGEIVLKVKDPNDRIHEFAFLDGAGETQRAYKSDQEGFSVLSTYGAAPDPSWGLKISLRTPKTMARHSFTLSDLALP